MKQQDTSPSAPCAVEMSPTAGTLYPELPDRGAPPDQSYRLQEISRLRKHLEDERDKRSQLHKKYRRGINILDGFDTALLTACIGTSISGVGLLSTVIAAPVVLGLEIAALSCGVLGVTGKFVGRRLQSKQENTTRLEFTQRAN